MNFTHNNEVQSKHYSNGEVRVRQLSSVSKMQDQKKKIRQKKSDKNKISNVKSS